MPPTPSPKDANQARNLQEDAAQQQEALRSTAEGRARLGDRENMAQAAANMPGAVEYSPPPPTAQDVAGYISPESPEGSHLFYGTGGLAVQEMKEVDPKVHAKNALDREAKLSVSRGATQEQVKNYADNVSWFLSNRSDNRVVLFEKNPLHPGGQAFLAGGTPDMAYLTPLVKDLEMRGYILRVPEPKESPYKPVQHAPVEANVYAAQPGQPTPLGRPLSRLYWDESQLRDVRSRQAQIPSAVPVPAGAIVPSVSEVERGGR